jgi:hypothetical protein
MKYYLYISDAKIDMLYPQVPHPVKEKVSTKFGFDLKILQASRTTEAPSDENRISRLEIVAEFIRESGNLGTVDKPDEYVGATMSMNLLAVPSARPLFMYFGGIEKSVGSHQVGLWGSMKHFIGTGDPDRGQYQSSSLAPAEMWDIIRERDPEFNPASPEEAKRFGFLNEIATTVGRIHPQPWWQSMRDANHGISYAGVQRMEFLAKRLMVHEEGSGPARETYLLATPLYIALAD